MKFYFCGIRLPLWMGRQGNCLRVCKPINWIMRVCNRFGLFPSVRYVFPPIPPIIGGGRKIVHTVIRSEYEQKSPDQAE